MSDYVRSAVLRFGLKGGAIAGLIHTLFQRRSKSGKKEIMRLSKLNLAMFVVLAALVPVRAFATSLALDVVGGGLAGSDNRTGSIGGSSRSARRSA